MADSTTDDELSLDEEFDPLADSENPVGATDSETAASAASQDDEGEVFLPYLGDPSEAPDAEAKEDDRPAEERIEELFERMRPRRKVLLGVLNFCREPKFVADVNHEFDRLQENDYSVFTAASTCELLQRAGALELLSTDEMQEPDLVEEDGVKYWQPRETDPNQWAATAAGIAYADADKPADRLRAKLEEEAQYTPIYLRILNLCANGGGATAKELGDAVDNDPLVQKPRLYAAYFFNILAEDDALEWTGKAWKITELGRAVQQELAANADDNER